MPTGSWGIRAARAAGIYNRPKTITASPNKGKLANSLLILQRRISKCDVWPFVFGHERAIAVGSWQYVVRFKLVTKTTLPDKLSL